MTETQELLGAGGTCQSPGSPLNQPRRLSCRALGVPLTSLVGFHAELRLVVAINSRLCMQVVSSPGKGLIQGLGTPLLVHR